MEHTHTIKLSTGKVIELTDDEYKELHPNEGYPCIPWSVWNKAYPQQVQANTRTMILEIGPDGVKEIESDDR
jgi:hypothetical protein